ncbi:MAG: hypothetical protein QM729_00005, partial [Solirubrobacterales bacterium]
MDPGPRVPRHRHRRGVRPRLAERRAREDREAGRHLEPEGLPQRDRQLRAARAGQQRRQEPDVDELREAAQVIEKKMFSNTEELLPVISFNAKASADEAKKHEDFVTRMVAKGYTAKQVRLLCEWYLRVGVVPRRAEVEEHAEWPCRASSTGGWRARTSPSATESASCAVTRSCVGFYRVSLLTFTMR